MASLKHPHIYKRLKKDYYRCVHPDCTHFIHKKLLLGKRAACTDCGGEFILTYENLRRAACKCPMCSNTKESKMAQLASSVMEKILENNAIKDARLGEPIEPLEEEHEEIDESER